MAISDEYMIVCEQKKSSNSEQSSCRIIRNLLPISTNQRSCWTERDTTCLSFHAVDQHRDAILRIIFCLPYVCTPADLSSLIHQVCRFHQNNTASATRIELGRTYPFTTEKYVKNVGQCLHNLQLCAKCMILRSRVTCAVRSRPPHL